jgi:hypothetical protein
MAKRRETWLKSYERCHQKLRFRMGKDTTQRQERTADRLILHATSKHGRRQRVRKIIKPCL